MLTKDQTKLQLYLGDVQTAYQVYLIATSNDVKFNV